MKHAMTGLFRRAFLIFPLLHLIHTVSLGALDLPGEYGPAAAITTVSDFQGVDPVKRALDHAGMIILKTPSRLPRDFGTVGRAQDWRKEWLASTLGAVAPGPQGILCGTWAGSVFWLDTKTKVFSFLFGVEGAIDGLSMDRAGTRVIALAQGVAFVWERSDPSRLVKIDGLVLDGSYRPVSNLDISDDGKRAILGLTFSDDHESWTRTYLLDWPRATITTELYTGTWGFSPNSRYLLNYGYDYGHRVGGSNHPFNQIDIYSMDRELQASFSAPGIFSPSTSIEDLRNKHAPRVNVWHAVGWNPFGLSVLTSRADYESSGYTYHSRDELAGPAKGPDLTTYRPWGQRQALNHKLGLRVERAGDTYGFFRFGRSDPSTEKFMWEKDIIMFDNGSVMDGALVLPDVDLGLFPMTKQRYDPVTGRVLQKNLLRFYRWSDGMETRPEIDLGEFARTLVYATTPGLDYILLGDSAPELAILEPVTERMQNWSGNIFRISGHEYRFTSSVAASVSWRADGKTFYLPAADGQVGSVVSIAANLEAGLIVTVDEAQRVFIRELAGGAVRYTGTLEQADASEGVRFSPAVPPSVGRPASRPWSSASTALPMPVVNVVLVFSKDYQSGD